MKKLQIFTTGGTVDKVYFDALSEFQIGEPVVGPILERMNVTSMDGVLLVAVKNVINGLFQNLMKSFIVSGLVNIIDHLIFRRVEPILKYYFLKENIIII